MARVSLGRNGRHEHPIWRVDEAVFELARLTAIVFSFDMRNHAGPDPVKRFVEAVDKNAKGALSRADGTNHYNAIYRLVTFENTPADARVLDIVADYVRKRLQQIVEEKKTFKPEHLKGDLDVIRAFADHGDGTLDAGFPSSYYGRHGLPLPSLGHIDIEDVQFEDASIYLTSHARVAAEKRNESSASYACFRYAVRVGEISKNLFNIQPCAEGDPVCRFQNTFKDRHGNVRNSSGVVFKEAGWVYFVGKIDGDNGIKALAMNAVGKERPALVQALVMSKALEPIVSRAALKRLDEPMPERDIRVADERTDREFSSPEFRNLIIPLIQNGVEFRTFEKIIYKSPQGQEREVSQAQMVQMIPSLLAGEFLLRDQENKDRPFNPASHDHYPFNQAITIKDQ